MGNPAYDTALKLLSQRDHFRSELEEKLQRKGIPDDEIDPAIRRLAELGLLDDEGLAGRFVEFRAVDRGWGPHRLEAELRRRGVDGELAGRASRIDGELAERALQTALRRVEVQARPGWWRVPDGRARLIKSLIARGFETDVAIRAVGRLAVERESPDDEIDDQLGDPGGVS
ncbi:MAG: recombination regulator RecX [Thermoanaerobaculales bacterium]|jgi:regulatory protein|nr:recombination regulator RecX [Thermoanaerobaculales bacterium]